MIPGGLAARKLVATVPYPGRGYSEKLGCDLLWTQLHWPPEQHRLEIIACGLYAVNYLYNVDTFETSMLLRRQKAASKLGSRYLVD
jgi:hypothetical protein